MTSQLTKPTQIVTKLGDTDYIIMGVKAGPKKIEEIREKDLDTVDEEGFFDLLRNGVPESKRRLMAAKAAEAEAEAEAEEPPKKKSKSKK